MGCGQRGARAISIALILFTSPRAIAAPPDAPAAPEAPPAPDPSAADKDRRTEAEGHFNKGSSLRDADNWAAALAEFREARRLYPLRNATYNAGFCLEKLQRFDEALDMFEALLREFGDKMPVDEKEKAQRRVAKLRGLVGTIEVEGAEPGAVIAIDGKSRGEYPVLTPLRVVTGSHTVRVTKEGFEPFATLVDVVGGKTLRVSARLHPFLQSGRIQVTERSGKALSVVVDGSIVGKAPWDGQLAVGSHIVALHGEGNLGTAPVSVCIGYNQTTSLTLAAEELAGQLRVAPVPENASIMIDAVKVSRGAWEGRLPAGTHRIEVAAEGFLIQRRDVVLELHKREVIAVELERDPTSPYWSRLPRRPRLLIELGTAVAFVPTFGGDIAGGCIEKCRQSIGAGAHGVVHGGYELGSGFGFGLLAGYLTARQAIAARETKLTVIHDGMVPTTGSANDWLELHGLLAGAWAGYTLGEQVPIHLRIDLGALIGSVSDARSFAGTAMRDGSPYAVRAFERHTATFFYTAPEVRAALPLGKRVELSAGVSVPFLVGFTRTRWSGQPHGVSAGTDGYSYFNADAFTGAVVVAILPGVGARYDF